MTAEKGTAPASDPAARGAGGFLPACRRSTIVSTALDPGSGRRVGDCGRFGAYLLSRASPVQPDRHAAGGGNLPLHRWAARIRAGLRRPAIDRQAGGDAPSACRTAHTGDWAPAPAHHLQSMLPNAGNSLLVLTCGCSVQDTHRNSAAGRRPAIRGYRRSAGPSAWSTPWPWRSARSAAPPAESAGA